MVLYKDLFSFSDSRMKKLGIYDNFLINGVAEKNTYRYVRNHCISRYEPVHPAKTQISLGSFGSPATHAGHSEDWSDWTDAQVNQSLC